MDTYQAIYDAVRSRISGGNIGEIIADAARNAFDISYAKEGLKQDFSIAAEYIRRAGEEHARPFMTLRPQLFIDGNVWCALYGENIQSGVAAFGDTPEHAAKQFDLQWMNEKAKK